jgi:hypothetical protein
VVTVGEHVGETKLWASPGERRPISELLAGGSGLFLFYLFDWSST